MCVCVCVCVCVCEDKGRRKEGVEVGGRRLFNTRQGSAIEGLFDLVWNLFHAW